MNRTDEGCCDDKLNVENFQTINMEVNEDNILS